MNLKNVFDIYSFNIRNPRIIYCHKLLINLKKVKCNQYEGSRG